MTELASSTGSGIASDAPEAATGTTGRWYAFIRSIPTGAVWLLVIIWSIPSLGLFINSWRSREAQISTGWWTVRPSELTLDNYDQIFGARNSIWNSLANSFAIALPATIIPDCVRGVRRVRIRMDPPSADARDCSSQRSHCSRFRCRSR